MLAATVKRSIALAIVSAAVLAGSAAVALAHSTPYSWSVSKARVMLQEGTNIALPADQRAALDSELAAWLVKFRPLLLTAQTGAQTGLDPRAARLAQTYDSYIVRLKKLRATVNSGLSIDSAKCVGQGKASIGKFNPEKPGPVVKQYKHFRCNASSYTLEIPNIELDPSIDPSLPEVVEGSRRLVGPFQAGFSVHVTGNSRMTSQRTS
jgi:hypothetical protein